MNLIASDSANPNREFILYRWWDAHGVLLYVGKSISLFARIAQHRGRSEFFARAATMTIERHASPEALGQAETDAIKKENPLHNIVGGRHDPDRDSPTLLVRRSENLAGYWAPVEYEQINFGDLIRVTAEDSDAVVLQGLVDDWEEDDDGHLWLLHTATGETAEFPARNEPLVWISRWETPDPDDPVLSAAHDISTRALAGLMED